MIEENKYTNPILHGSACPHLVRRGFSNDKQVYDLRTDGESLFRGVDLEALTFTCELLDEVKKETCNQINYIDIKEIAKQAYKKIKIEKEQEKKKKEKEQSKKRKNKTPQKKQEPLKDKVDRLKETFNEYDFDKETTEKILKILFIEHTEIFDII